MGDGATARREIGAGRGAGCGTMGMVATERGRWTAVAGTADVAAAS